MKSIVILGLGLFLGLLILQILIWQLLRVRKEMFFLALIYICLPTIIFIGLLFCQDMQLADLTLAALLYYLVASVYVQTYPALREDTPSFRILLSIERMGKTGLTENQIIENFAATDLFSQKMTDLKHDGLVEVDQNGKFKLNSAGRKLATIFKYYRSLLGLEIGEG